MINQTNKGLDAKTHPPTGLHKSTKLSLHW